MTAPSIAPAGRSVRRQVGAAIAAWVVLSFVTPASGIYDRDPLQILPSVMYVIPGIVFVVWYRRSAAFREFIGSISLTALIWFHVFRLPGLPMFYYLYRQRILPGSWVFPAMSVDLFLGATAPWMAGALSRSVTRATFVAWNSVGIVAIVVHIVTRMLNAPVAWGILRGDVSSQAFNVLPYALFPQLIGPALYLANMMALAVYSQSTARSAALRM